MTFSWVYVRAKDGKWWAIGYLPINLAHSWARKLSAPDAYGLAVLEDREHPSGMRCYRNGTLEP